MAHHEHAFERKRPCKFWMEGDCWDKDKCPFSHAGPRGISVASTKISAHHGRQKFDWERWREKNRPRSKRSRSSWSRSRSRSRSKSRRHSRSKSRDRRKSSRSRSPHKHKSASKSPNRKVSDSTHSAPATPKLVPNFGNRPASSEQSLEKKDQVTLLNTNENEPHTPEDPVDASTVIEVSQNYNVPASSAKEGQQSVAEEKDLLDWIKQFSAPARAVTTQVFLIGSQDTVSVHRLLPQYAANVFLVDGAISQMPKNATFLSYLGMSLYLMEATEMARVAGIVPTFNSVSLHVQQYTKITEDAQELSSTIQKLQAEAFLCSSHNHVLQDKLAALKCKLESLQKSYLTECMCWTCKTNPKQVVFMPCLHLCLCSACAGSVNICPICSKSVSSKMECHLKSS